MEKVHCFFITDASLKRTNTYVDTEFIFSQKFRALKYMTRALEPIFLCFKVFRS